MDELDVRIRAQRVTELLALASGREPVQPADSKSQSIFGRLTVDAERYFLKRSSPATDCVMCVTGDHVHRPFLIWEAGLMNHTPVCIGHPLVAMEINGLGDQAELSILMRDVSPFLVPDGNETQRHAHQHRVVLFDQPVKGAFVALPKGSRPSPAPVGRV